MVLGPSGLIEVEGDRHAGGADGLANLAELEALHGALPRTFTYRSGGGGLKRVFRAPAGTDPTRGLHGSAAIELAPAVELLSGPDITVLPPSPHRSGKRYEIVEDCEPAELPAEWVELAR